MTNTLFEIMNYRQDLEISVDRPQIISRTGEKNIVSYRIKNISGRTITFKPQMYVNPPQFQKYVVSYDCLCSRRFKLKAGQEVNFESLFKIDRDIEKDLEFKKPNPGEEDLYNQIVIGFKII